MKLIARWCDCRTPKPVHVKDEVLEILPLGLDLATRLPSWAYCERCGKELKP